MMQSQPKSISEYVAKLSVQWLTIRSFLLGINNCIPEDAVVLQQVAGAPW